MDRTSRRDVEAHTLPVLHRTVVLEGGSPAGDSLETGTLEEGSRLRRSLGDTGYRDQTWCRRIWVVSRG